MSKDEKMRKLSILNIGKLPMTAQNTPTVTIPGTGMTNEVNPFRHIQPSASMKVKMEQLNEATASFSKK